MVVSPDEKVREEIISIPKKVFDYTVSRLKFDYPGFVEEREIEEKFDKLSGIHLGEEIGVIGYKRDKTSSSLLLWVHPYCHSSYKIKICCGFFHDHGAIYEKIHISFPSFGLTIFSPDQIGIISVVLKGLKRVTPFEPFRRVK